MDHIYTTRLKMFRKSKMTQGAFSEILGVSSDHYTKIENGLRNPSLPVHIEICLQTGKPSDCFFKEDRHDLNLTPEQMNCLLSKSKNELRTILKLLQSIYEES